MPLMLVFAILSSGTGEVNIVPSPFWSLTILYFLQVIAVIVLTINMTRKLRAFERKYSSRGVDAALPVGETFSRWKLGWMTAPDLLETWLVEMSAEGNDSAMGSMRFTFERGAPKRVSYILDYQWRPSTGYTEIHKSAGWQLKYTSSYLFMKYSLWAKVYEEGELRPKLTYDIRENKAKTRKILWAQCSANLIALAFIAFVLWIYFSNGQEFALSSFQHFIVKALIVSIFLQIYQVIRTIRYAFRMRKV